MLPALNDLRLNERSTRGRSLVALELPRSARSGFFPPWKVDSSVNKRLLAKSHTPTPDCLVCVSWVFWRHLYRSVAALPGRADVSIGRAAEQSGVWEQKPQCFQTSGLRVFIHNGWTKLLHCLESGVVQEIVLASQGLAGILHTERGCSQHWYLSKK